MTFSEDFKQKQENFHRIQICLCGSYTALSTWCSESVRPHTTVCSDLRKLNVRAALQTFPSNQSIKTSTTNSTNLRVTNLGFKVLKKTLSEEFPTLPLFQCHSGCRKRNKYYQKHLNLQSDTTAKPAGENREEMQADTKLLRQQKKQLG